MRAPRAGLLMLLSLLAYDAATIVPAVGGLYVVKRKLHYDTVPGVDMLPDETIRALALRARRLLGKIAA